MPYLDASYLGHFLTKCVIRKTILRDVTCGAVLPVESCFAFCNQY